jgi:hypothetical protein
LPLNRRIKQPSGILDPPLNLAFLDHRDRIPNHLSAYRHHLSLNLSMQRITARHDETAEASFAPAAPKNAVDSLLLTAH